MKNRCLKNNVLIFAIGAVIGLISFLLIYGAEPLLVTKDGFLLNGYIEKDSMQHYAGWLLYRQSPWQFPLGVGQNISYPVGTSVFFTDSIPLFAVLFKVLSPILPQTFQYFGLFVLTSFMLMGAFGAAIIYQLTDKMLFSVIASLLFTFSPVMMERAFRHTALSAQWLIVAALYVYLKNQCRTKKCFWGYVVINVIAITIHPYFVPLCFAVFFADLLQDVINIRKFNKNWLYLPMSLTLSIFTAYVLGAFYTTGAVGKVGGYGYFSFNLNSFFNPISRGVESWSRFIPPLSQTQGNYESFSYLGLGVIVFFAVTMALGFKDILKTIKRHAALSLVLLILAVFAVTNQISFFSHVVTIPLPSFVANLASTFRASGRMMWVLYYLIIIFTLYRLSFIKVKGGTALLAIMVALQLVDISPAIATKRNSFDNAPLSGLKSSFWQQNADKIEHIESFENGILYNNIELALLAGKNNMSARLDFAARYDTEYTKQMSESFLSDVYAGKNPKEKTLYIANYIAKYKEIAAVRQDLWVAVVEGQIVVSADKSLEEDNLVMPISFNSLIACDLSDSGRYAKGVNATDGIVAVDNSDHYRSLLEGKTRLMVNDKYFNIIKTQTDGEFINIYLEKTENLDSFSFPTVFTAAD